MIPGLDVVDGAIHALTELRTRLAADPVPFEAALERLRRCEGRVVCTGMGKSGIVARKLSATLASTGTPAWFLHPGDAGHGDVGAVRADDLLLAVSDSGESPEILALLPVVRRLGVPVLALTGNRDGSLARLADVVLDTFVSAEAGPHALAPTTSTTVAMVLGDALAMARMAERGFSPADFARAHPAGRLGRRLVLTAADVMRRDLPLVEPQTSLLTLIEVLGAHGMGAVLVLEERRLVGLVTDGDLRRALGRSGRSVLDRTAEDVMTRQPVVVEGGRLAAECVALMEARPSQISVLPVVDATGEPVGIVRLHDLVQLGLR